MSGSKQHFGQSISVAEIVTGQLVPVGGSSLYGAVDIHVQADFSNLQTFFETAEKIRASIPLEPLAAWLEKTNIKAEPELFAAMWSFQQALEKHFPEISKNAVTNRTHLYIDNTPLLSDVIQAGCAECTEVSLLAHHSLHRQGISCQFFVGAVAWSKDQPFSDPHAFLVLEQKAMIYDPFNPISTSAGFMPGFSNVPDAQFAIWDQLKETRQALLLVRREISGVDALYGVSNGDNINPEKDIITSSSVSQADPVPAKAKPVVPKAPL